MKHRRFALAVAVAVLTAHSAFGASLTMLQFGSFETRAEAEKRLGEVTSKHAAFVGKLATNIREIKLPPDNLTVYRTQAGPVENRAAAQSICAQLASAGDECYIVQTAMVAAPASTSPPADTAASTVATPSVAPAAASAPATATQEVTPATEPTTDLTRRLTTLSEAPARDPANRSALNSITTPSATETLGSAASTAAVDAAPPEREQVTKALDTAIENQPKVDADLAEATGPGSIPKRGFWDRFNPFSSAPAKKAPAPAAATVAPEAAAAPVEEVASQALAVPAPLPETSATSPAASAIAAAPAAVATVQAPVAEVPSASVVSAPAAAPAAASVPAIETASAPVTALSQTPITLDTRPVIMQAEPLPLPPPPAPLRAQDRASLLAAARAPLPNPEPIAAVPLAAPLPSSAGNGLVQVEEAKRVPVTQAVTPPPAAPVIQAVPVVNAAPAVSLSPSATEGQKAIWAQIGPFSSSEAALAYWASYRQTHPDFPVVRVRVATPYQQQLDGNAQSWLRVGPVTQVGFVNNLCASLGPNPSLRCGMIRDLGTSSPLARTPGQQPTARYKR